VVVTDAPADLRVLESGESLGVTRSIESPLEALLGQLATGRTRSVTSAPGAFAIRWRGYRLFPIDASLDLGAPEVDANPSGSPPPRVATEPRLRIELDARAVTPGLRIDVLVCARSSAGRPFQATTLFEDRPGALDIWSGDLSGVVDIYLWSSTSSAERRALAELLALRDMAGPAAGLREAGALAEGVSMQVAAMARAALFGLAPDVVTAFRGSFGADLPPRRYAPACGAFEIVFRRG
jgi:hypothetical protein